MNESPFRWQVSTFVLAVVAGVLLVGLLHQCGQKQDAVIVYDRSHAMKADSLMQEADSVKKVVDSLMSRVTPTPKIVDRWKEVKSIVTSEVCSVVYEPVVAFGDSLVAEIVKRDSVVDGLIAERGLLRGAVDQMRLQRSVDSTALDSLGRDTRRLRRWNKVWKAVAVVGLLVPVP
jgi:hypothetical protein